MRCGKAFGSTATVRTMVARLSGHALFATEAQRKRLLMCGDCRVIDMMEHGEMPGAQAAEVRQNTLDTRADAISPEDEDRAGFYGLVANLLAQLPHPVLLASLAGAGAARTGPGMPEAEALARAWSGLRAAARGNRPRRPSPRSGAGCSTAPGKAPGGDARFLVPDRFSWKAARGAARRPHCTGTGAPATAAASRKTTSRRCAM